MKKKIAPLFILVSSLILSSNSFSMIFVPDLMGSMIEGERAAQQANRYDEYYGSPMTRRIEVYKGGSETKKLAKRVSKKKGDNLCYSVRNLQPNAAYYVTEIFVSDRPFHLKGITDQLEGTTGNWEQVDSSGPVNNRYNINKTMISDSYGYISTCWTFYEEMPTGDYGYGLKVNRTTFELSKFSVIN